MEAYVKSHGAKKAYLIKEALQHHLQALREIPEDLIIPVRLVLSEAAMECIAEQITAEDKPTEDLKALFRGRPGNGDFHSSPGATRRPLRFPLR